MFQRTFRTIRSTLAPRWLTEGEGKLVGYALDLVKDAAAQRAYLGLLARFPQNDPQGATTAPPDALAAMGRDRRLYRGIAETDQQYAARLKSWLDDRRTAGTAFTMMKQLHAYTGTQNGVSFRVVDNSGNWYTRSASGVESASLGLANWNWDNKPNDWSRFWVIVYPGTLWATTTSKYGAGLKKWGLGGGAGAYGATITPEQAKTLTALVNDWKPAGTTCMHVILAFDPASFSPTAPEPDGTWGKFYKYSGGVAVASRLATARYLDGAT